MRKITVFSLMLIMIFASSTFANGPKKKKKVSGFQGMITYKITYEGRELTTQEETQMPNKKITMYVGAEEIEKQIAPMGSYFTVINHETNAFTIVIDQMGQAMYGQWTKEEKSDSAKSADKPDIKMEKLDGSKTIAGYKCKKANVTVKNKKGDVQKMTVYYTEDLKAPYPDEDFDIGGIVLQTEILLGDEDDDEALTQVTTAIEIKKGKVKKKEYAIPAGATKIEKEKFMQLLGGAAK